MTRAAGRARLGFRPSLLILAGVALLASGAAVSAWSSSLPAKAAHSIRQALLARVDQAGSLDVRVVTRPALGLLRGRVDRLEVTGQGLRVGQIVADRFSLYGEGLQVDLAASASTGRLAISSARQLTLELVMSEQSLNRYLQATNELARLLYVKLLPEGPRLLLEAQVQDQVVRFGLDGRLTVESGNVVVLVPDRLSIEQDGALALQLSLSGADTVLRVELGDLPVPVVISGVETGDGELHIFGSYRQAP